MCVHPSACVNLMAKARSPEAIRWRLSTDPYIGEPTKQLQTKGSARTLKRGTKRDRK